MLRSPVGAEVAVEFIDFGFGFCSTRHIEAHMAAGRSPAKRGVADVMIEHNDVPRFGFGSNAWNIPSGYPQEFVRLASPLKVLSPRTYQVTAGNYADASGIPRQRVKIQMIFGEETDLMPAIGVPSGIAAVVVSVAANIVEIIAEQRLQHAEHIRMV